MSTPRSAVWVALLVSALAACEEDVTLPPDDPQQSDYPLEGTECSYLCGGPGCNLRCDGDVLYRCVEGDVFEVEDDCVAQGKVCVEMIESPYEAVKQCE